MELPKPLPKEKTPEPLVIPSRKSSEPKDSPNDDSKNVPMPIVEHTEEHSKEHIEEHHEEPEPKENHENVAPEPNDDIKNTPMEEKVPEENKAPVDPTIKAKIEEETKDASAIADAIIMSHTATTKTASKRKSNIATLIVLILSIIAVFAVLFFGGIIKIGDNQSGEGVVPLDDPRGPRLAKKVCESYDNYEFIKLKEGEDEEWYVVGGEADAEVKNQYICRFDPEKEDERPEDTFEFTFVVLNENYEDIDGFKDYLSSTSEYYTILEDSDEFFKCLTSTNPHIYLTVYKTSLIHLYSSNVETAEKLLKDLKFPDRAHAQV